MAVARVYLAVGQSGLRALLAKGSLGPSDVAAYTVTPQARADHPDLDEEGLEYDAYALASEDPAHGAGPTVVLAADIPKQWVQPAGPEEAFAARLSHAVQLGWVVSAHVQAPGSSSEEELAWYDASELDEVAGRL
jgi:hypothetical protein